LRRIGSYAIGLGLAATIVAGCKAHHPDGSDGGDAAAEVSDGSTNDGPTPLTLDFAIGGCGQYDGIHCSGYAPMVVSFAPVGSPELTRFLWTFGDGTPAVTERAPTHRYTRPGPYDVKVVGAGDVGSVEKLRVGVMQVDSVSVGGPCDLDVQCGQGFACTCLAGACGPAFSRGICSTPCPNGECLGATCVDVATPTAAGGPARSPLCLASCNEDGDCATGFVCSTLPGGGGARWQHACLPRGAVIPPGQSCRGANGELDDAACATGDCESAGTQGLCSAPCGPELPCPDGMACARFAADRQICLPACDYVANACATDPLLACQVPGDDGVAFSAPDATPGISYCAPKPCSRDDECTPRGHCAPDATCVGD
jgi:PKD repeat protein